MVLWRGFPSTIAPPTFSRTATFDAITSLQSYTPDGFTIITCPGQLVEGLVEAEISSYDPEAFFYFRSSKAWNTSSPPVSHRSFKWDFGFYWPFPGFQLNWYGQALNQQRMRILTPGESCWLACTPCIVDLFDGHLVDVGNEIRFTVTVS